MGCWAEEWFSQARSTGRAGSVIAAGQCPPRQRRELACIIRCKTSVPRAPYSAARPDCQ